MLQIVPAAKIKVLGANREPIDEECTRFFRDKDVLFCIRVYKDTTVEAGSGTGGANVRACSNPTQFAGVRTTVES